MKMCLKKYLLIGLCTVFFVAGIPLSHPLTMFELIRPSHAGTFTRADAGPASRKCKEKCKSAYQPLICNIGCDYFYSIISSQNNFTLGDLGPLSIKCKSRCTSKSVQPAYCQRGCEYYYSVVFNW